jgi:hypothetical protein
MDRQTILNEINRRKNLTSGITRSDIEEELRKRQRPNFSGIVDDTEVPELSEVGQENLQEIEEYLKSPQFRRLALEITGGVLGAFTGGTLFAATKLMRPALGLLYRSLGAGIGEGTAAGVAQTFDPRDDLAKEVLRGFITGASAETIGAAIPAIIKKIGFKGVKYTKDAQDAEDVLTATQGKIDNGTSKVDDAAQGMITPGIGSDNRYVDVLENIAEKSLFGGDKILKARKGAENIMTNEVGTFINNFSDATTRVNAGELALEAVKNSLDTFRANAKVRYDALSNAAEGVTVNIQSTKDIAAKLLKEAEPTQLLERDGIKVLKTIENLDPQVSFSVANNVRSKLLGVSRSSKDLIKGQGARYAQNVTESLTKNIDDAAEVVPGNLKELYDRAQNFYKKGVKKYNDKTLRSLTSKAPEEVYKTLIKPNRESTVKNFIKVINGTKDKELRDELIGSIKGTMLLDIASESNRLYRKLNANYLLKEFDKFGKGTLEQIFTKDELSNIRSLFNTLDVAQRKTVGEGVPGGMFIQLTQAGAVFGLATGAFTAPSAAILLTPYIAGKMLTNKKIVNFMKKGFQLNPGSKEFYTNASQILGAMVSNNLISEDEAEDFLEDLENSK